MMERPLIRARDDAHKEALVRMAAAWLGEVSDEEAERVPEEWLESWCVEALTR